ncbi:MAG: hypothetical protein ACREIV_12615 [Planctomycetaceae bacterium]
MVTGIQADQLRLGFLTANALNGHGYVGGLLVTNRFGRPLEFQCTTPVKPNRTQEILYGPTLVPFILAELIGRTLIEKVGVKPHLVLVERPELLELRGHVAMPVACLASVEETADDEQSSQPPSDSSLQEGRILTLGRRRLRLETAHAADDDALARHAPHIPGGADLLEPFERVREALQEALQLKGE